MDNLERDQVDFTPESYKEVKEIVSENLSRECFRLLSVAIESNQVRPQLQSLIESGINEISDHEDMQLGSYFFVLSEVQGLDPTIRDFLLDTMLWCEEIETNPNALSWKSTQELTEYFRTHVAKLL